MLSPPGIWWDREPCDHFTHQQTHGYILVKTPALTHLSAWLQKDQIILYDVHKVFQVDALASSHPLSRREEEVNDPPQISEMFNTISYSKVCSSDGNLYRIQKEYRKYLLQFCLSRFFSKGTPVFGTLTTKCFNSCFGLNFTVMRKSSQPSSCGFCVCCLQGAAVLRMLSEFLTEPVFARGLSVRINPVTQPQNLIITATLCLWWWESLVWKIEWNSFSFPLRITDWLFVFSPPQSYLNTFAFSNTVYTDLWDHLQEVGSAKKRRVVLNFTWKWVFLLNPCGPLFVLRQLTKHQVFIFHTLSMTSWTAGPSRWAFQWSLLTPGQEVSLRNTSCWIQNL